MSECALDLVREISLNPCRILYQGHIACMTASAVSLQPHVSALTCYAVCFLQFLLLLRVVMRVPSENAIFLGTFILTSSPQSNSSLPILATLEHVNVLNKREKRYHKDALLCRFMSNTAIAIQCGDN